MTDCFWNSVVGLSRTCTPVGTEISFTPTILIDGTYRHDDGDSWGWFQVSRMTAYMSAAVIAAGPGGVITGVSYIKPLDGSGPSTLGDLGGVVPSGTVFTDESSAFPFLCGGCVSEGRWGRHASDTETHAYYYGRINVAGETFYGIFAVGDGV